MGLNLSSEAVSRLATQEMSNIWNPKFYYGVHNGQILDIIMSQINPIYIAPSRLYNLYVNTFSPPISRSCQWFFPYDFNTKILKILF
jgi:hypothetical protein